MPQPGKIVARKEGIVLDQEFMATARNEKWVTEFTYIANAEGWLYQSIALDLYSRRVIGWAATLWMNTELVLAAPRIGLEVRRPPPGLLDQCYQGSH